MNCQKIPGFPEKYYGGLLFHGIFGSFFDWKAVDIADIHSYHTKLCHVLEAYVYDQGCGMQWSPEGEVEMWRQDQTSQLKM